jgi:phosphatidylglycerol:prolipoprotein diacylglycerol transferase
MYPILFRVGAYTVYSYTVAIAIGLLIGTWFAYRLARERNLEPTTLLDGAFWALLGGVLGARAAYVLFNWAYYANHLEKTIRIAEGGLSWHGALFGGSIAAATWLALRRHFRGDVKRWRDLLDASAPGLALGGALGWVGCLLTGSGYGAEAAGYGAPLSWLAAPLPDIYGVEAVRFLTQPLMIVWCTLLWFALWRGSRYLPAGLVLPIYVLSYAAADLGVTFLRGDGTWRQGLWLTQWVALVEMAVAAGVAIWLLAHRKKGPESVQLAAGGQGQWQQLP